MPKPIKKEMANIEISGIRKFNNQINDIPDMIRLTLGEPDFKTPEHIKQKAIKAIHEDFTNYTANAGMPELRAGVANYLNNKHQLEISEEEVIITVGATEAIAISLETILTAEDEVILPDPVYPGYEPLIQLAGAKTVKIDTTETAFKVTPEALKKAITDKTKAVILPYPSNPTGVTLTKKELEDIANILRDTGIYVIADEIYSELTYQGKHYSIRSCLKEQAIVINGLSKSHAMIGWRIGFLIADKWLIQEMLKIHQYTVTCATSISQVAALEAVSAGADDPFPMRTEYKTRAGFVFDRLTKMGFEVVKPDGAFYFFVKLPDEITIPSFDWAIKLAHEAKVAVVPGNAFSEKGDRYFRLSYAASFDLLAEAMDRLANFMEEV
ncbi:aminotransferase class I/II-fold pyridoxal phosphate-dependent enzyme [Listeria sp. PSOL-1]|uniref:aminotransferase class I/II-fold pyridoxal phosphate-dependent enzyme n=1 Tax=Listeria sp. PSOL-1 TaxID=1844999 RepID=UPI0013D07A24|nr:aminotransferase class I/II-fold pyridoxal phosphate-dependent enzyme [Listeria sp. PSOL-1]